MNDTIDNPHISVMLDQVLAALAPKDGETYVDATFGHGGYTKAFLDAADCNVIAIDRDPSAIERAEELKQEYGDRFTFKRGAFSEAERLVTECDLERIDGFIMDIGVSSMQIDQAERGFSFRHDGPLDMRMDYEGDGETAADIVNGYDEGDLAQIIKTYGEERHARKIARLITKRRGETPFITTKDLASLIEEHTPMRMRDKIHPATRTFQALRIHVNDELGELKRALHAAERILTPEGRLIVVSFHSLEDSIVKRFMRERSQATPTGSRHLPQSPSETKPSLTLPQKKAYFPTEEESETNPRARSARMRVALRTDAPVYSTQKGAA